MNVLGVQFSKKGAVFELFALTYPILEVSSVLCKYMLT